MMKKKTMVRAAVSAAALLLLLSLVLVWLLRKDSAFVEQTTVLPFSIEKDKLAFFTQTADGFFYALDDYPDPQRIRIYYCPKKENSPVLVDSFEWPNLMWSYRMEATTNGLLFLAALPSMEKGQDYIYQLNYISKDGTTILATDYCHRIPYLYPMEKGVLLNTLDRTGSKCSLEYFDFEQKTRTIIDETACVWEPYEEYSPEPGLYRGDQIIFAGGDGETVYYQKLNVEGATIPERDGTPTLVGYSLSEGRKTLSVPMEHVAEHLTGTGDYVILSEYDFDTPLPKSGKVFSITDGTLRPHFQIPEIAAGDPIIDSYIAPDGRAFLLAPRRAYVYDYEKNTVAQLSTETGGENDSFWKIGRDSFSYLECLPEQTILHTFTCAEKEKGA